MSCDVGRFGKVAAMLEEIHFPKELIASRTRESFLEVIRKSGVSELEGL